MEFSKRLNSIFEDAGEPIRGRATTLQKLTGVSNTGTQKWLNGDSVPRRAAILTISRNYGRSPEWLEYGETRQSENDVVFARENKGCLDSEYCDIYFMQAFNSQEQEQNMRPTPFKKSYLTSIGVKPEQACMIIAPDDRMEPDINKGDEMLVDRSKQKPEDRCIYVFKVGDYNRVSLVTVNLDESITLVSKSKDPSFPNEVVSRETLNSLEIVGQVRWSGGSK